MTTINISRLSNDDLIANTKKAAANERHATVELVALLAEVDARELYLSQGCSSLFAYCTRVLHLSEDAAYHRIEAARAAQRFPVILDRLGAGELTLTAIGLLRKHLTAENQVALLDRARHQSTRDIQRILAELAPKPDVAPMVRRLPSVTPLKIAAPAQRPPTMTVIATSQESGATESEETFALDALPVDRASAASSSGDRYLLRVTISGDTQKKLDRARDLLRHAIPNGDPAAIVDRALTVLVEELERTKIAATSRPRKGRAKASTDKGPDARESPSRHLPAEVRRTVWARDGGRCTFVGTEGRCVETGHLEFHHVKPYARGGRTDAANLTLRCRAHNAYEGRLDFGDRRPRTNSGGINSVRTESSNRARHQIDVLRSRARTASDE